MKNFKRFIIMMITAMLSAMCIGFSAFAEETAPKGTITVTNSSTSVSIDGKDFTAYKVFSVSANEDKMAYTITPEFKPMFVSAKFTAAFADASFDDDSQNIDYVNFMNGLTTSDKIEKFANCVYEFANDNSIPATATAKASGETATFSDLDLGYYAVFGISEAKDGSNAVTTAVALDTTAWDAESGSYKVDINAKLDAPTIDKAIVENQTDKKATTASIGDTVNFKITSKVPDITGYTSYTFVVTDTLSKGLTFNNDVKVTVGGDDFTVASDDTADVTVSTANNADDATVITLTFNDFYNKIKDYTKGDDIVITYSADLNEDAVIGNAGNPNTVKLTYSNNPHDLTSTNDTTDHTVKVYSFEFDIQKFTINSDDSEATEMNLPGAEFELSDSDGAKIKFSGADGVYKVDPEGTVTTLQGDDNGKIVITGLAAGEYLLQETKAPDGYKLLEDPMTINIDVTYSETDATQLSAVSTNDDCELLANNQGVLRKVENTSDTLFPTTGGIGSTIFFICGGALALAAVIYFTVKKIAKSK
ncbi:MAG: SpaH/EbpB family LPXTG-anchored major pilin [Oscillospiraceae bacterium]